MLGNRSENTDYVTGQSDTRPWGNWRVVDVGDRHVIKQINVEPNCRLSLQLHHKRSEHWIIVAWAGMASVEGEDLPVQVGSLIHIPENARHRIANTGGSVLTFIEVQLGAELRESDIVRIEDDYNRV